MAQATSTEVANSLIEDKPMRPLQLLVVFLCILINVSDAAETGALAAASPVLMKDLGIGAPMLGLLFSFTSMGVVAGSLFVAPFADRFGRRTLLVTLLGILTAITLLTPFATSAQQIFALRVVTGLCIGGIQPNLSVMVIEFANKKWGSFLLSNLYMSFALGGMIISAVAAATIVEYGWHLIFWFAGTFHLVVFLACLFLLPESLSFLLARHPKNALARANKLLARLGGEQLAELPPRRDLDGKKPKAPVVQILTKSLLMLSVLLWVSSFAHFFSAALTGGLQAKILVDMGISIKAAVGVGMVSAPASAVGVLLMGILASKFDPLKLTIGAIAMASIGHFTFGLIPPVVSIVYATDAFIGFFHAAVFAGTLMYVAKRYPPEVRGTGIGWTIGIGRLGTMSGSAFGGFIIGAQWDRPVMFSIMAAVCAIGGLAIWATTLGRPAPAPREATA